MTGKIKEISLNNLVLDQNNPRFKPTLSQDEAISYMIVNEGDGLVKLAEHIIKNDINPSVLPIVYKNPDGKNIVKDGNRRVCTLKILSDPNLIKDSPKYKTILNLSSNFDKEKYSKIKCLISDDLVEINTWVLNNHQGPQNGVGQKPWNSIQKARYMRLQGKFDPVLEFLEYIERTSDSEIDENNFSIDTLSRILNTNSFKDLMKINISNEKITIGIDSDDANNILTQIVSDINDKKVDTRKLRTKNDREQYIELIKNTLPKPNVIQEPITIAFKKKDADIQTVSNTKTIDKPRTNKTNSNYFDDIDYSSVTGVSNCESLCLVLKELKSLRECTIKKCPIATSFLIRSAYEYSLSLILQNIADKGLDENTKTKQMEKFVEKAFEDGRLPRNSNLEKAFLSSKIWREFLNSNVHTPNQARSDLHTIRSMSIGGIKSFIQETINYIADNEHK